MLGNSEEIQEQAALLDEREELKIRLTEVDQKLESLEHKGFTSRHGVIPALQQDLYRSRELEHRLTLPKPVLSNPKGDDYGMARVTPKRFYLVRVPTHYDNYAPGSELYTSREGLDEWGIEHGLDIDTTLKVWKEYQNA